MVESDPGNQSEGTDRFKDLINDKQLRMLTSRRNQSNIWISFTTFGVVGWMIAFPLLAGIAVGVWLDRSFPAGHSWTLTLLSAGLLLGCASSWRWVEEQRKTVEEERSRLRDQIERELGGDVDIEEGESTVS